MALPYEAPRSYTAASGGIPVVVDPEDALKKSIAATQSNLDATKTLGRATDKFAVNQYTGRVPGYKDMSQQSSDNIAAALRGEVPQDVLNQLSQQAAERGISRGIQGSQASNADYLRGLGLTSLGLQKYGEEALTGATHRLDAVKQFDPTTFSVTPEAQYNAMTQANVLGAAPDPEAVYQRGKADLAAGSGAGTRTGGQTIDPSGIGAGGTGKKTNMAAPSWGPVVGGYGTRPDHSQVSSYSPWDINGNWIGGSNAANNPSSDFGAIGTFDEAPSYASPWSYTGAGSQGYTGAASPIDPYGGNYMDFTGGFGGTGGFDPEDPYADVFEGYNIYDTPAGYDYTADWNY